MLANNGFETSNLLSKRWQAPAVVGLLIQVEAFKSKH